MRNRALAWLKAEFEKNYEGKVVAAAPQPDASSDGAPDGARPRHLNAQAAASGETSTAGFFANSDSEESEGEEQEGE